MANELTNISYLGSILKIKGDRRGDKYIIMIKVENGLNGWKGSTLSHAGCRNLIQSITSMIPNYWFGFQLAGRSLTSRIPTKPKPLSCGMVNMLQKHGPQFHGKKLLDRFKKGAWGSKV